MQSRISTTSLDCGSLCAGITFEGRGGLIVMMQLNCAHCGVLYSTYESRIGRSKYCSKKCKSDHEFGQSRRPPEDYFFSHAVVPKEADGCWIWNGKKNNMGYGQMSVAGKMMLAHRFGFEIHNGYKIEKGMDACHKCDNPICVNPKHIFIGTRQDNMSDASRKGRLRTPRGPRGADHHNSKLNDDIVRAVRLEVASENSRTIKAIAATLGVSAQVLHAMLAGKTWRHVL